MTENRAKLTLVLPEGTEDTPATEALILAMFGLAGQHDLKLSLLTGESVSPITVSGDIDLVYAEKIKQAALSYVRIWEETY